MSDDAHGPADRLRKAYQQLDRAADLARAALRAAVPAGLPDRPPLRFGTASRRPGAIFDAWPSGDGVTAFLGHAAGHGGAAEVIGLLVARTIAAEELRAGGGLPPGELLARVNRVLLGLDLPDPPLASLAVVRVEPAAGRAAVARAGVPAPVYVPAGGDVEVWSVPGPLLGVYAAEFPTREGAFRPGGKLVLATADTGAAPHRGLAAQALADAVVTDDAAALVVECVV